MTLVPLAYSVVVVPDRTKAKCAQVPVERVAVELVFVFLAKITHVPLGFTPSATVLLTDAGKELVPCWNTPRAFTEPKDVM